MRRVSFRGGLKGLDDTRCIAAANPVHIRLQAMASDPIDSDVSGATVSLCYQETGRLSTTATCRTLAVSAIIRLSLGRRFDRTPTALALSQLIKLPCRLNLAIGRSLNITVASTAFALAGADPRGRSLLLRGPENCSHVCEIGEDDRRQHGESPAAG